MRFISSQPHVRLHSVYFPFKFLSSLCALPPPELRLHIKLNYQLTSCFLFKADAILQFFSLIRDFFFSRREKRKICSHKYTEEGDDGVVT